MPVLGSFMKENSRAVKVPEVPVSTHRIFERADMKRNNKKWLFLLLIILVCSAFTCGQAQAGIATDHIFLLSPNNVSATYDFYSYSPAGSLKEAQYFLVIFGGLQTAISTLTVKLSSSPVFMSYTGSVTYSLFAVGYPLSIYCAKAETATNSTVASNYITAEFPVNSKYGFAIIGAALLGRHDASSDVKMSLKVAVEAATAAAAE